MKHFSNKITSAVRSKITVQAVDEAEELGRTAGPEDVRRMESTLGSMNRGPLAKVWHMVQSLWAAFRSPDVPAATKALIIGGLLYVVAPFDVIPDAFGPAGLLDDAAVIAFIYAQCRDLIVKFIPQVTEQVKNGIQEAGSAVCGQIDRITDEALEATVGRAFRRYCLRTFCNSLLKLALFTTALLLLYFSSPGGTAGKLAASVLLLISAVWFAAVFVRNCAGGIGMLGKFIPVLRQIRTREKQNALSKRGYTRLRWYEAAAEALYTAFAEPALPESQQKMKKFYAFVFRRWNEGKLPRWVPNKGALVDHVWNSLKFLIFSYLAAFSGYLLVYNLLVKGLLLRSVTNYSLLQLIVYPFVYTFALWH